MQYNYNHGNEMFKQIQNIFNSLQDDESKDIFFDRLRLSMISDSNAIEHFIKLPNVAQKDITHEYDLLKTAEFYSKIKLKQQNKKVLTFFEFVENYNISSNIVVWGAGAMLSETIEILNRHNITVECICDMDPAKQKMRINDLEIISPELLKSAYSDAIVIINSVSFSGEIYDNLIEFGFTPGQIVLLCGHRKPYFDVSFLHPVEHEIYVDVGSGTGNNILDFIDFCFGKYDKIYAFEPDPYNFSLISNKINRIGGGGGKLVSEYCVEE